jgi:hypothetical protein
MKRKEFERKRSELELDRLKYAKIELVPLKPAQGQNQEG